MPDIATILIGAAVVGLIVYIIWQYWPAKRPPPHAEVYKAGFRSIKTPNGEDHLVYVHNSNVDADLRRAISVGAVLSEQNIFPTNRIETGKPRDEMRAWLNEWWGIRQAPDARHEIQHLFDRGHRLVLDRVAELGGSLPTDELTATLVEEFGDLYPEGDLREFAENFAATGPTLVQLGRLGAAKDLPAFSTLAYDIGRAVTVARVAASADILDIGEAEAICRRALEIAQSAFPTWSSFATSYLAGRALWGGVDDPSFDWMCEMVEILLDHEQSPWNELPLRG